MIVPNCLARQEDGVQGEEEAEDRRKGGQTGSLSVRGVGCKEQEKTWMVV